MKILGLIILTFAITFGGCSRKGRLFPPPPPGGGGQGPVIPPPPRGGEQPPASGAIGQFHFLGKNSDALTTSDKAVIEKYTGRLFNKISDPRININLNRTTSGNYAGSVTIYYYEDSPTSDDKVYRGSKFSSGNLNSDVVYNNYIWHDRKPYFKAFFEDKEGALILVGHAIDDLGVWGGRIYFKNFKCGRNIWEPPCNFHKPNRCWNIQIGPYECRDFLTNALDTRSQINMNVQKFPRRYTFIGTFEGIDPGIAFKN